MNNYVRDPGLIEAQSMEIIQAEMAPHQFDEWELPVAKRMIHTTGDFDYQNIVRFHLDPVRQGIKAIQKGVRIVTDTTMALSGINKRSLADAGCEINNYIADPRTFELAKERQTTRSVVSMDLACAEGAQIFVIGNAPTALYRLGELIEEGKLKPDLIIGVPVGFVGAAESKEFIRSLPVPSITTEGRKGGSNVAAAVMNAIIYLAKGMDERIFCR